MTWKLRLLGIGLLLIIVAVVAAAWLETARRPSTVEDLVAAIEAHSNSRVKRLARLGLANEIYYDPDTPEEWTRPVHVAAAAGYDDVLSLLLAHGADPNGRDRWGSTPLKMACAFSGGSRSLRYQRCAEVLIEAGADVNALDSDGRSCMHWAAGDEAIAKLLIAAGADVNARDNKRNTPLHHACMLRFYDRNLVLRNGVSVLLDAGADPNAINDDGLTVEDLARMERRTDILDALRQYQKAGWSWP